MKKIFVFLGLMVAVVGYSQRIENLPTATDVANTDLLIVDQTDSTRSITVTLFKDSVLIPQINTILDTLAFTMLPDSDKDTVVTIDNGKLTYSLVDSLNAHFNPRSYFTTDTNCLWTIYPFAATSATAQSANTLRAYPFMPERTVYLEAASIELTIGNSDSSAFAIYSDVGTGKLYPDTIYYNLGIFGTDNGTVTTKILPSLLVLEKNKIYWLVYNYKGTPTARSGATYTYNFLGYAPTIGQYPYYTHISKSVTWSKTLPDPFPSAGSYTVTPTPVFVGFKQR